MPDNQYSIRKRIVDQLLLRLAGSAAATPMPDALGKVTINTNRRTPIGGDELPMYSVYYVNDVPQPVGGDRRRPVLQNRGLTVEVRVIAFGDDDASDAHCQWITQQMAGADQCIDLQGNKLALGITEADTIFEPLDGSQNETTVTRIRWVVEYTTSRLDITRTN